MSKLKVGIVGWGTIADIHARAIVEARNCELTSVYTSNKEKEKEIEEKYDVNVYNNYEKLLKSDVDIVSICTPSGTHLNFGKEAAKCGKHVVVEKPIEVTIKKAKELIEVCRENEVKLGVILQNRYLSSVQKIKKIIKEDKLGKIFHASAYIKWWRSQEYYDSSQWRGTYELDGGGTLMNQSIHTVDLLVYLTGKPVSVASLMGTFRHDRIEVEDSVVAIVKFENGAIGSIEASTSIQPAQPRKIEIHGEKGTVVLEGDEAIIHIEGIEETGKAVQSDSGADSPLAGFKIEPHKKQFEEIAQAIIENREPEVNGVVAMESLAMVEAIYKSGREGRFIDLKEML